MRIIACSIVAVVALTACSSAGTQGPGGAGGATQGSTGAAGTSNLEAVCEANVSAMLALPCAHMGTDEAPLVAACVDGQNAGGDQCVPQHVSFLNCETAGGLTCMDDALDWVPCVPEQITLAQCVFEPVCNAVCAREVQQGCAPSDCVEACEKQVADAFVCSTLFAILQGCLSTNVVCDGGMPAASSCASDAESYQSCVQSI
jgi:hypothetical protein